MFLQLLPTYNYVQLICYAFFLISRFYNCFFFFFFFSSSSSLSNSRDRFVSSIFAVFLSLSPSLLYLYKPTNKHIYANETCNNKYIYNELSNIYVVLSTNRI